MAFRSVDTIQVVGLRPLLRELRGLDEPAIVDELKDANYQVASLVARRAEVRARALGGMEAKAASTLTARRAQRAAEVSLGGAKAKFAAGAEFGAYRNRLRLLKNKTGAGRGRAYIVRDETAKGIAAAKRRIEAQRNINTGEAIRVNRQVRGWNQFRPWRGNSTGAGYFLFPTIRESTAEIVDMYGDAIEQIARKAFPD